MKTMTRRNDIHRTALLAGVLLLTACSIPASMQKRTAGKPLPGNYAASTDTTNSGIIKWREFFKDPNLLALIDTALQNNQEQNILMQEITIAKNEVRARKGEYLPFVGMGGAAGVEKSSRYTRAGAVEANTTIAPGKKFPDPLHNYTFGPYAVWEVDIWNKLRTAKKAAALRYLSTTEGRNFMVTHLIAEIAQSYYELLALDNQLDIVRKNIDLQSNALEIVKLEKQATRVTELAVRKFEAEVYHTRSLQFEIQQRIIEAENRINFLVGRYAQPVQRNAPSFSALIPDTVYAGLPSQLMENRPDIRQAELALRAARLDVKVAKANFYPSLTLTGGLGYEAFNPQYLLRSPEALVYSMAGELAAPLINRNAIKANYYSANARQIQAVYAYERTVLKAYIEVVNQLSNIRNLDSSYTLKNQQVQALTESIDISTGLFRSARADYMEVLLTQRDALEAKFDLIETRQQQLNAVVNLYRALGGGWR